MPSVPAWFTIYVDPYLAKLFHVCLVTIAIATCNIGTSDLHDMYAQNLRAEGIHIRQIMSAYVTTNM